MKFNFFQRLMTIGFFGMLCTLIFSNDDILLLILFFVSVIMFLAGFVFSLIEVIKEKKNKE